MSEFHTPLPWGDALIARRAVPNLTGRNLDDEAWHALIQDPFCGIRGTIIMGTLQGYDFLTSLSESFQAIGVSLRASAFYSQLSRQLWIDERSVMLVTGTKSVKISDLQPLQMYLDAAERKVLIDTIKAQPAKRVRLTEFLLKGIKEAHWFSTTSVSPSLVSKTFIWAHMMGLITPRVVTELYGAHTLLAADKSFSDKHASGPVLPVIKRFFAWMID
jgi:hypothetical protein